jgi:hypothetical protein
MRLVWHWLGQGWPTHQELYCRLCRPDRDSEGIWEAEPLCGPPTSSLRHAGSAPTFERSDPGSDKLSQQITGCD